LIFYREIEVSGLSKLIDDLVYVPDELTGHLNLTSGLSFPLMSIKGMYILQALLFDPETNAEIQIMTTNSSSAVFSFGVSDVFVNLNVSLIALPPRKLELTDFKLDFGFKNLTFIPEGLLVEGQPMDLSHLAGLVQSIFDAVWIPENKPSINELIRCAINYTVHVS
jgi:hypothetical protein